MFSSLFFTVMLVISFFRVKVNKTKLDSDTLRESLLAVSQFDTLVNSLSYIFQSSEGFVTKKVRLCHLQRDRIVDVQKIL